MIGGNVKATLQQNKGQDKNKLGEVIQRWADYCQFSAGWLDLSTGTSKYTYDAKLQDSTHVFITDYAAIDRKADDKRLVVNGVVYDVLLIDDPMELHQQLEIYLRFVG